MPEESVGHVERHTMSFVASFVVSFVDLGSDKAHAKVTLSFLIDLDRRRGDPAEDLTPET